MSKAQLDDLVTRIRERSSETLRPLEEARAEYELLAKIFPLEEDITCEAVSAGGVPAEWSEAPGAERARTLFYLHGGGYAIGSIVSHRSMVGRLARAMEGRALSLDYRLAPEHPHPAALEDAKAAYRWLLEQGSDPARMVVGGDSAGGGLVLALLLALRDEGTPLPAGGLCISPWTDLTMSGESITGKVEADPMVTPEGIHRYASYFLGESDPCDPYASPLFGDPAGLPPLLIQVGTAEVLLDDATRFAEKARAAGVEVSLETWEDMIHVWHYFAPRLEEGQQAIERAGQWCREKTG